MSSTFDGTAEERRVLLAAVMPALQTFAHKLGFDGILSEMRFGIRDSDDHKASEICISELHRCFEVSSGICYFLTCGDKYGFRPMPRVISEAEMRQLSAQTNAVDQALVLELYELEENSVLIDGSPAPEFVLKHAGSSGRSKANSDVFWRVKYPQ